MKHKSRYIVENIRGLKDKVYELSIITPLLCDKDLFCVRPYTQFPVKTTDDTKNYIDLSYSAAKKLDFIGQGIASVIITELDAMPIWQIANPKDSTIAMNSNGIVVTSK